MRRWLNTMKRKNFFEVLEKVSILCSLLMLLIGCAAGSGQIQPISFSAADIDPSTPNKQQKENVAIEIDYIGFDKSLEFPEFYISRGTLRKTVTGVQDIDIIGVVLFNAKYPADKNGITIGYPFEGQTAFLIKITNNTDHILRMKDARIFLVVGEDTHPALGSKQELVNVKARQFPDPDKFSHDAVERESARMVANQMKQEFLNHVGMEILPGFSKKGIIVFDVRAEKTSGGTLSLFDVTTQVDQAGNPLKKTRFDFKLKLRNGQVNLRLDNGMWVVEKMTGS